MQYIHIQIQAYITGFTKWNAHGRGSSSFFASFPEHSGLVKLAFERTVDMTKKRSLYSRHLGFHEFPT